MYPRGGDCNVAIATARMLESEGHQVRCYAMQYPENIKLPESDDYAPQVDFTSGIGGKLRAVKRMLGLGDIKASFRHVIKDFRPDVVHLHNIHSYLSPVIGEIAASMGVRVVWTMHDYKLICPSYSCRRPDGKNCEDCFSGKLRVLKHKCMKNSYGASAMAYLEASRWHRLRLERFCSAYICPSAFMADCLKKSGFSEDKLHIIPNFADESMFRHSHSSGNGEYFCYIGRLSEEKGVATLLKAAHTAGVSLVVTGDGPLRSRLEDIYGSDSRIKFTGRVDAEEITRILLGAKASVMPSEWYENNPLGVIESLCMGVPVIGADIAGISELIHTESTFGHVANGLLYPSGDAVALARLLNEFDSEKFDRAVIAAEARSSYNRKTHYSALMQVYAPKGAANIVTDNG